MHCYLCLFKRCHLRIPRLFFPKMLDYISRRTFNSINQNLKKFKCQQNLPPQYEYHCTKYCEVQCNTQVTICVQNIYVTLVQYVTSRNNSERRTTIFYTQVQFSSDRCTLKFLKMKCNSTSKNCSLRPHFFISWTGTEIFQIGDRKKNHWPYKL